MGLVGGDPNDVEVLQECEAVSWQAAVARHVSTRGHMRGGSRQDRGEAQPCSTARPYSRRMFEAGWTASSGSAHAGAWADRTISKSVVSEDDDVEFGCSIPAQRIAPGSCETSPDLRCRSARARDRHITAAQNLQQAAHAGRGARAGGRAPGRLGEPGVSSALIVVSDGGNSCDDLSTEQAIERLSLAASTLRDRGIKVYALRFGPQGADFAAQDAQLRAIAVNGGTAPADPNSVPYLEAPDHLRSTRSGGLFDAIASAGSSLATERGLSKETTNLFQR